ncbi:unnamed protein product [Angiostrongylus costaricensis]|uniref:Uncharacterized protein n=1 Tax=Angiostrongylus costaricensis TaxID=334426 RepID=A0A0R3PZG9_ANGCS|nr:unnamed protein product [Angiostrongylus costaricensis]
MCRIVDRKKFPQKKAMSCCYNDAADGVDPFGLLTLTVASQKVTKETGKNILLDEERRPAYGWMVTIGGGTGRKRAGRRRRRRPRTERKGVVVDKNHDVEMKRTGGIGRSEEKHKPA